MRRWFILKFDEKRFAKELRENRIFLLSAAARYLRFILQVSRVIVRNQRMARGIPCGSAVNQNVTECQDELLFKDYLSDSNCLGLFSSSGV